MVIFAVEVVVVVEIVAGVVLVIVIGFTLVDRVVIVGLFVIKE